MLMDLGLTEADMRVFTKLWEAKMGEGVSPSAQSPESREAFLSVLREGLQMIASGSQHLTDIDPALKAQIEGYLSTMEAKFNDPNLSEEEFQSLMASLGPYVMSLGFSETEMGIFGQLWASKNAGESPSFDTRDVLLEVLKEGLYMLAARKSSAGDEQMMQQINGFEYELQDILYSLSEEGIDFMDWLENEFVPLVQGRFNLSDEDMYVLSETWREKMGYDATPTYETAPQFVESVINGLRKIASSREPAGKIDQETIDYIESYISSVEERINNITTEEEFGVFFQETVVSELSSFGLTEEAIFTI